MKAISIVKNYIQKDIINAKSSKHSTTGELLLGFSYQKIIEYAKVLRKPEAVCPRWNFKKNSGLQANSSKTAKESRTLHK